MPRKSKKNTPEGVAEKIADLILGLGPKYKTIGRLNKEEVKLSQELDAEIKSAQDSVAALKKEWETKIRAKHKALWDHVHKAHTLSPKASLRIHGTDIQEREE